MNRTITIKTLLLCAIGALVVLAVLDPGPLTGRHSLLDRALPGGAPLLHSGPASPPGPR